MRLSFGAESFPIAGTFTISRGSKTTAEVVAVEVEQDGIKSHGEGVPYARYNETVPQCLAALETVKTEGLTRASLPALKLPKAVANAIDCALWDLEAKTQKQPAWKLAGLAGMEPKVTCFTISLDSPAAMATAAIKAAHYPLLKLKLGREGDPERLAAIRAAVPNARLVVDANEGWHEGIIEEMLVHCAKAKVELVEQTLPQGQDEALRHIKRSTLICADESAHDAASLHELKGKYDAVNIKLDKTGGLTEALRMAHAARAQDFKIMVGCMLATSLAMAPAFVVAQLADYVDLDGPLWMKQDRQPSIKYLKGVMQAPEPALWG